MLVFIEGGPEMFANQAFQTDDLLNHPEFVKIMHDYRWTERTIRSTKNPELVAQVWRYHTVAAEQPAPGASPVPTAADQPNATASDATTREVDTVVHSRQIREDLEAKSMVERMDQEHPELMAEARREVAESADYTGPPVDVPEGAGSLPDGETLFLLRKRKKLTVQEVADAVGLNRSRVDSIEKGTAKRGDVTGDMRRIHLHLDPPPPSEDGGPPRD